MRARCGRWTPAVALVFALGPATAAAQSGETCPGGRAPAGDLGVRGLRCIGPSAACTIYQRGDGGALEHVFAVEPIVDAIASPSNDRAGLQVGDVLVALDGRLITTLEGGSYLANLPSDSLVKVVARRHGRLVELSIRTVEGCGVRSLSVTSSPRDRSRSSTNR